MTLVCFGDSLTYGYGVAPGEGYVDRLRNAHPDWAIVNSGVNGDTADGGLLRLEYSVLRHRPDRVLILFGSNDAARWDAFRSLAEYRHSMTAILSVLRERLPACKIYLITPPAVNDALAKPFLDNMQLEPYRETVRALARERGCTLIEFARGLERKTAFLQSDGVHLSPTGYQYLFQLVDDALAHNTEEAR